ncbi:MAG: High-affnity carbon uptake protein Hat/HatR [uncultured Sulfurovum sp.]|uniref:High-affnity carbon uptake protein Hat/HatR n=1 Tax=uncultured Sulfurovum sp. TaxID=269237 RepID=A0A6S6SW15_9BACT|nr:MAG: High-affnity carbon uptake protein Hat/HatR [uncultured Sulfurovum sp.]
MSQANPSTFLIKSSKNRSFGTGFCVHKDERGSYLVTCAHVVNACIIDNLIVDNYPAKLLYLSEDEELMDLAVVYVEGLTNTTTLKLCDSMAHEGDHFTVTGYRPHKDKHAQEPLDGFIKKSYQLESSETKQWIYELSINEDDSIEQGYSGSAVVSTETGLVMAVATDRKRDGKNAYATPIHHLKEIWQEIPQALFVSTESTNPYKGLQSFSYEDRHNYYGREKESKEIAKQLPKTKLFTLLGASGSGKSSLIFAGVMPLIENSDVQILSLRPQSHPFKSLATVFIPTLYPDKLEQIEQNEKLTNKLANNDIKLNNLVETFLQETQAKHLYLILDQFEELFTLTKEQKIRNHFLDQLLTLINSELNVTLLLSMRADFLSHLSYYEPFNQAYNDHQNTILSLLSEAKLRKVIEQLALSQGVKFQDGLVDRIIDEIENEAGQLPLLEFALDQLWTNKKGRVITHEVLDEMKSISHSISHYADKIYNDTKDKESIKKVLIKLVNPGAGTEDTRRIASLDEFSEIDRETIVKLASERLIVTQDQNIDIVHEALIREWGQLQEWIEEYREFLEWEKRLRDDRKVYEENGSKKEDLLKDSRLLKAEEFVKSHEAYIAPDDKAFVDKSSESDKKRKRRDKLFIGSAFLVLLSIIAVISYLLNLSNNKTEEAEKAQKNTQQLLYKNTVQQGKLYRDHLNDPLKSKLIFTDAIIKSTNEVEYKNGQILYNSSFKTNIHLNSIKEHKGFVKGATFSKDEQKILSWSHDGTVKLWETQSKEALQTFEHKDKVLGASFSKDEQKILSWSRDGTMKLWDTQSKEALQSFKHEDWVNGASFSKDEQQILSWSGDGTVKLWDSKSNEALQSFKHECWVKGASFSKDEQQILSWSRDGTVKLWDSKSNEALQSFKHESSVYGATFSKDEQQILSWSGDGTVKLWDSKSNEALQSFKHESSVYGATFSKDEQQILSWSGDGTVKLWDSKSNEALQSFKHESSVYGATFSKDEQQILSWSGDGTVKLWDSKSNEALQSFKHEDWVNGASFSKDEQQILSWSADGTVKLWDSKSNKALQTFKHERSVNGATFTKDEQHILSWSYDGTVKLWDIKSQEALQTFKHERSVNGATFTKDEQKILSWSWDGRVNLWDIKSQETLQTFTHEDWTTGVYFSQDAQKILSWNGDGMVKLWDTKSQEALQTFKHEGMVEGALFSKDEKRILSWSKGGMVKLWDAKSKEVLQTFEHKHLVLGATFSKDEQKILSWSSDGTVQINKLYDEIDIKLQKEDYPLKVEVETGVRLKPSGELEVLKADEWREKKKKWEERLEELNID